MLETQLWTDAGPLHPRQWDETLVLALSGMGRLLRAHLRVLLAVLPRFDEGWEELMLVVESSMAGGRHETAVAAVSLLTAVLQVGSSEQRTSLAVDATCLLLKTP